MSALPPKADIRTRWANLEILEVALVKRGFGGFGIQASDAVPREMKPSKWSKPHANRGEVWGGL